MNTQVLDKLSQGVAGRCRPQLFKCGRKCHYFGDEAIRMSVGYMALSFNGTHIDSFLITSLKLSSSPISGISSSSWFLRKGDGVRGAASIPAWGRDLTRKGDIVNQLT